MGPRFSIFDVVDGFLTNAVVAGYFQFRLAEKPDANSANIIRAKSLKVARSEASFKSVHPVLVHRSPFKIFNSVVRLYSVLVINLRLVLGIRDEVLRDHASQGICFLKHINKMVSVFPIQLGQYLNSLKKSDPISEEHRTDVSGVAHFVKPICPFNLNPLFVCFHANERGAAERNYKDIHYAF